MALANSAASSRSSYSAAVGCGQKTVFLSVGPEIGLVMSNAFGHLPSNERASDMRKSWKEYKREARQRQRTLDKERERELNTTVYRRSFSDFMREDHRSGFAVHFLILGMIGGPLKRTTGSIRLIRTHWTRTTAARRSIRLVKPNWCSVYCKMSSRHWPRISQPTSAAKSRAALKNFSSWALTARMPIEHWMIWDASRRCGTSLASVFEIPSHKRGHRANSP